VRRAQLTIGTLMVLLNLALFLVGIFFLEFIHTQLTFKGVVDVKDKTMNHECATTLTQLVRYYYSSLGDKVDSPNSFQLLKTFDVLKGETRFLNTEILNKYKDKGLEIGLCFDTSPEGKCVYSTQISGVSRTCSMQMYNPVGMDEYAFLVLGEGNE